MEARRVIDLTKTVMPTTRTIALVVATASLVWWAASDRNGVTWRVLTIRCACARSSSGMLADNTMALAVLRLTGVRTGSSVM